MDFLRVKVGRKSKKMSMDTLEKQFGDGEANKPVEEETEEYFLIGNSEHDEQMQSDKKIQEKLVKEAK